MKSLNDYINDLDPISTKENAMKKLKKYAQSDLEGNEALYETNADRWSRNAKHQMAKSELSNTEEITTFEKGETVIYENNEVIVKIPQGANGKVGIMFEGHLKMVSKFKIMKLDEGAIGGMLNIAPLNRMMQLAGINTANIMEPVTETILNETDVDGMFSQLVTSATNLPQYKGNAEAARLYVIGSLLALIYKDITTNKFQTVTGQSKMQELNVLGPMGADLIKSSQSIVQGQK